MKKINVGILDTLAKIAEANDNQGERLAAAVVRNNKIISVGYNHRKSHPFQAKYAKNSHSIFLHAEVHAIKNALRNMEVDDLSKCELYVARVKKTGPRSKVWVWGLAKPCSGCQRAITEFGFKRVVYTTNENGNYEVL